MGSAIGGPGKKGRAMPKGMNVADSAKMLQAPFEVIALASNILIYAP